MCLCITLSDWRSDAEHDVSIHMYENKSIRIL